jgi:sphingosine kinase
VAAKRFVLVVNARGGAGRAPAVLEAVKPVFQAAGTKLDVRFTESAGHAERIAQTADLAGCRGLCVIGGDGTIHEVVGGLMKRDDPAETPLGVIPGGTGNAMVEHLRCVGPLEAARRIVAGGTRPLDVVRATMGCGQAYCVNVVGWGAAVDINCTAERLRRLGPPRYALAALAHILHPQRRRAKLVLDGRVVEDEFLFVLACNTKFSGRGMCVAPRAESDDGKVDVLAVRPASRFQLWKLFRRVFTGSHLLLPFVDYCQASSFSIEPEGPDLLNLDGELKGAAPISGETMPGALRVFV